MVCCDSDREKERHAFVRHTATVLLRSVADCIVCTCLLSAPQTYLLPLLLFSAELILETVQNPFWSNLMECLYWLCASLTPSSFLSSSGMFFFLLLLGGLWQYLLHYAQTCRRENHKLFFLTDVLISLIPFWLWPGRKPENSKSVSSKLCAGVEKSIRCLSMPRIWMGERERKTHRERIKEREPTQHPSHILLWLTP